MRRESVLAIEAVAIPDLRDLVVALAGFLGRHRKSNRKGRFEFKAGRP
jgi:hypothetical protein